MTGLPESGNLCQVIQFYFYSPLSRADCQGRKCQLAMKTCNNLGHIVGNGMVRPALHKVQAAQAFAIPQTKSDVRAFLGLTGHYRIFIPNYDNIAVPLTDLTKKTAPNQVCWDSHCETAFNKLKALWCSSTVLQSPDFSRQFIVQTDASNRGVEAVLIQADENGIEHPVSY